MTALPTLSQTLRVLPVLLFGEVTTVLVARAGLDEVRLLPMTPAGKTEWSR